MRNERNFQLENEKAYMEVKLARVCEVGTLVG